MNFRERGREQIWGHREEPVSLRRKECGEFSFGYILFFEAIVHQGGSVQ